MIYVLTLTAVGMVAAAPVERVAESTHRPRRWVWAALAVCLLLPFARPDS